MSTPVVETVKLDQLNCWRIRHGQAELLVAQQGAHLRRRRRHEAPIESLGAEVPGVVFEHLGRIARGVHGDEEALQLVPIGPQRFFDFGQLGHGGRAHVRALGETKKHHHDLAFEVSEAAYLPIVVGELKVFGVGHAGHIHRRKLGLGLRASTQQATNARK